MLSPTQQPHIKTFPMIAVTEDFVCCILTPKPNLQFKIDLLTVKLQKCVACLVDSTLQSNAGSEEEMGV
jgi:hypothetical protein